VKTSSSSDEGVNWGDISLGLYSGSLIAISKTTSENTSMDVGALGLIDTGISVKRLMKLLATMKRNAAPKQSTLALPSGTLTTHSRSSTSLSTQQLWDFAEPATLTISSLKMSIGKSPLPASWPLVITAGGLALVKRKPIKYPFAQVVKER
jgi:hypothetical protein